MAKIIPRIPTCKQTGRSSSPYNKWVHIGGVVDVSEIPNKTPTGMEVLEFVMEEVSKLIATSCAWKDMSSDKKLAIPVLFCDNEMREFMRTIPFSYWEEKLNVSRDFLKRFGALEFVRDKDECILWFIFSHRRL